jgi:hypothetical protein
MLRKSAHASVLTASNHLYIFDYKLMSKKNEYELDAADICERLVGITPIYLQNFVSRGLYGLRASVKPGKVRTQRRLFSRDDVFGIALVWLLFESGLRGEPIARVLNDIGGTNKSNANVAAKKLLQAKSEYLLILRKPRGPTKNPSDKPVQETRIITQAEASEPRPWNQGIELLIPVGHKFRDIERRMELLFPPQGG